jgi:hypothetical protein
MCCPDEWSKRDLRPNAPGMRVKLQIASAHDVGDLVSLRIAVNQNLRSRHEEGYWSWGLTEEGVLFALRTSTVSIAGDRNTLIATLRLSPRKPGHRQEIFQPQ